MSYTEDWVRVAVDDDVLVFDKHVDVMYAVPGRGNPSTTLYNVTGKVFFNKRFFGVDPAPGEIKVGYARIAKHPSASYSIADLEMYDDTDACVGCS